MTSKKEDETFHTTDAAFATALKLSDVGLKHTGYSSVHVFRNYVATTWLQAAEAIRVLELEDANVSYVIAYTGTYLTLSCTGSTFSRKLRAGDVEPWQALELRLAIYHDNHIDLDLELGHKAPKATKKPKGGK